MIPKRWPQPRTGKGRRNIYEKHWGWISRMLSFAGQLSMQMLLNTNGSQSLFVLIKMSSQMNDQLETLVFQKNYWSLTNKRTNTWFRLPHTFGHVWCMDVVKKCDQRNAKDPRQHLTRDCTRQIIVNSLNQIGKTKYQRDKFVYLLFFLKPTTFFKKHPNPSFNKSL